MELKEGVNYLDLFSGIGGFRYGFEKAGYKINWSGHSEIDKPAQRVYERHWSASKRLGDITTVESFQLPQIDLLTFGFPCQDLSIAGQRKGLAGKRSGLFYEAMRIIRATSPTIFIFENVKGLLCSDGGRDFVRILREIADLGVYECEWQLLNTRWLLPQNRERIFFIGHLRGKSRTQVFPFREDDFVYQGKRITAHSPQCVNTLDANYYKGWQKHGQRSMIIQYPHGYNKGSVKDLPTIRSCNSFSQNELLLLDSSAFSLRCLTPIECERLQGFPDGWTEGESDTQRYKMLGNAVSTVISELIGRRLKINQ